MMPFFFIRIASDVVAHGLHANRSVGCELVGDEVALGGFAAKVPLSEILGSQMTRGSR